MGVTIHYSGRLGSPDGWPAIRAVMQRRAEAWGTELIEIDKPEGRLLRFASGELVEYIGPVRGFAMIPHADCEGLRFLFDDTGYMEHFCKTQFAPAAVHMDIVGLLEELEPLLAELNVHDEGGYWGTRDADGLCGKLHFLGGAIDAVASALDPETPIKRTPSGPELN